jgi:ABC-type uncharacterized transport system permease subunit
MSLWPISLLAVGAYLLAAFFRALTTFAGRDMLWHGRIALSSGLVAHLAFVAALWFGGSPTPSGFPLQGVPVLASLTLVFLCVALEFFDRETFFSLFVLPLAALLLLLSPLTQHWLEGTHFQGLWFLTHVVAAVLGECFFVMAGLAAATYWYQVRKLKGKNRLRATTFFPPLARLDALTLRFLGAGTLAFAIGVGLGASWSVSSFGHFHWSGTKQKISLLVLFYFLALLGARWRALLVGPRLAAFTVVGSLLATAMAVLAHDPAHWFPGGP